MISELAQVQPIQPPYLRKARRQAHAHPTTHPNAAKIPSSTRRLCIRETRLTGLIWNRAAPLGTLRLPRTSLPSPRPARLRLPPRDRLHPLSLQGLISRRPRSSTTLPAATVADPAHPHITTAFRFINLKTPFSVRIRFSLLQLMPPVASNSGAARLARLRTMPPTRPNRRPCGLVHSHHPSIASCITPSSTAPMEFPSVTRGRPCAATERERSRLPNPLRGQAQ